MHHSRRTSTNVQVKCRIGADDRRALAARSGVAPSALRFYEREGLIASERTDGNQRRYPRVVLRRVALIQAGKAAGIPLERIRAALARCPPTARRRKRDWARLSAAGAASSRSGSRRSRRSAAA